MYKVEKSRMMKVKFEVSSGKKFEWRRLDDLQKKALVDTLLTILLQTSRDGAEASQETTVIHLFSIRVRFLLSR